MAEVVLYTDGACSGNPGPGGWAYILHHSASGRRRTASGGSSRTTNNRMEMRAVIHGLRAIKRSCQVTVVTDSQYVVYGATQWMEGWKAKGWRTAGKKRVKNVDLWKEIDELLGAHEVRFQFIPGHTGHPENEQCDQMAVAAAEQARRSRAPADMEAENPC